MESHRSIVKKPFQDKAKRLWYSRRKVNGMGIVKINRMASLQT